MAMMIDLFSGPMAIHPDYIERIRADYESVVASITPETMKAYSEQGIGAKTVPYAVKNGVAQIPLKGIMLKSVGFWDWLFGSGLSTPEVQALVELAAKDEDVQAIDLIVDSPGGQVAGVPELADAVKAANAVKPVRAVVDGMCASAAYWVASQASEIIAGRADLIGSVGVVTTLVDAQKQAESAGLKFHVIASGSLKGMEPGAGLSAELIADTKRVVDTMAALFFDAVSEGREGVKIKDISTGQVWLAKEALALGLIDSIKNTAPLSEPENSPEGEEDSDMADPANNTPPADPVEDDKDLEKEIEEKDQKILDLEKEIEELKNKDDSSAEALANAVAEQKSAVIASHANRITPAMKPMVEAYAETASYEGLKAFLGAFPVVTNPTRDTDAPEPPKVEDVKAVARKEGDAKAAALFGIDVKSFDAIEGNTVALTGWVK